MLKSKKVGKLKHLMKCEHILLLLKSAYKSDVTIVNIKMMLCLPFKITMLSVMIALVSLNYKPSNSS